MSTHALAPAKPHGMKVWAVFNLFAAVVWGLIGCVVFAMSLLDVVHDWVKLIPLLPLGASFLSCVSGLMLLGLIVFQTASDGHPPGAAILAQCLAILGILTFWVIFVYLLPGGPHLSSFGAVLVHIAAVIALLGIIQVVYLWRKKLSSPRN